MDSKKEPTNDEAKETPAKPPERETVLRANRSHDGFEDVEDTSDMDEPTLRADALDFGEKLKISRERLNMSIASVAETLKLDVESIEALETGDLDVFRGRRGIFVEGHYRAYAGLLNVDVSESSFSVIRARPVTVDAPGNLKINYQTQPNPPIVERLREKSDAIIFALVAVMIAVVGTVIWMVWPVPDRGLFDTADSESGAIEGDPALTANAEELPFYLRDEPSATQRETVEVAEIDASASEQISETGIDDVESTVEAESVEGELSIAEPVTETQVVEKVPVTLILSFSGNSWVEVYDREDTVMYYKMGSAGEETTLVGQAPFRILIGDTTTVSLVFNDSSVDLEPYTVGVVASLTLE